jgi:hypothetical protein
MEHHCSMPEVMNNVDAVKPTKVLGFDNRALKEQQLQINAPDLVVCMLPTVGST